MKKLLALVLALVMTLGLATVGASAAYSDFTDTADVSFEEAMKVMNAVGVFVGDGNKLDPKGNLTRAQAAKLVAYLALGEDIAEALPKTGSKFTDAPDGAWFTGYVNYMANEGYTSGTSATTFSPNGELNGYQFGAFLLAVLGYDRELEGMVGNGWETKVAVKLEELDITDGVDKLGSAALTREEAAQFCLNALKADTVKYSDKGTSIDINGAKITTGAKSAESITATADSKYAAIDTTKDGTKDIVQLGEKLYKGDLVLTTGAIDDFGRPADKWSYKKDSVGTFTESADESYVVAANNKTVEAVLTDSDKMNLDSDKILSTTTVIRNGYSQLWSAAKAQALYRGDVVEVYENDDDDYSTVVIRSYTAAKITKIDTSLNSSETAKGAKYKITLKTIDENGTVSTLYDAYDGDSAKELPGFNAATYTKGTVIAVARAHTAWATLDTNPSVVLDSYVAETVSGAVGSYKANDYVYVGGTQYKIGQAIALVAANGIANNFNISNTNYNFYLDANGYVIGNNADYSKIEDVYYITGLYVTTGDMGGTTYYAQRVALDGTKSTVELEAQSFYNLVKTSGASNYYLQKFTASGSGDEYALSGDSTLAVADKFYAVDRAMGYLFTFTDSDSEDVNPVVINNGGTASDNQTRNLKVKDLDGHTIHFYGGENTSTLPKAENKNDKFTAVPYIGSDNYAYSFKSVTSGALVGNLNSSSTSVTLAASGTGKGDSDGFVAKKYVDSNTKFLILKGNANDLKVTTSTGSASVTANADIDTAVTIYADGKNVASYVLIVGTGDLASSAATDEIIYIDDTVSGNQLFSDGYHATIYQMDDASSKDVVIDKADASKTAGFYTYSTDSDNVYSLTAIGSNELGYSAAKNPVTKADTGAATGFTALEDGYYDANNTITATATVNSNTVYLDDAKFGNAVVIDTRSSGARDADIYSDKIESVDDLKAALDAGNVTFDAYIKDGVVTFIAVTACEDEATVTVTTNFNGEATPLPAAYTLTPVATQTVAKNGGVVEYTLTVPAGASSDVVYIDLTGTGAYISAYSTGFTADSGTIAGHDITAGSISVTSDPAAVQTFTFSVTVAAVDVTVEVDGNDG